jgi:hypothetical protein
MDEKHDKPDSAWRSWGGALGIAIVLGVIYLILQWML